MRTGQNGVTSITMEEQSRKFAKDKTIPVKGTLEINNANGSAEITLNAENLQRRTGGYKLFFIGRNEGNSVYKIVGDITPDRAGKAGFRKTIDPSDVDGSGTGLQHFYIFMLAAAGIPLTPVLKGDLPDREVISGRKESRTAVDKEYTSGRAKGGNASDRERAFHEEKRAYNGYYKEYVRQKTAVLIKEKGTFLDISPFGDVWLADNWKRVTDLTKLPVASAGAEQQILRYGHFIFGHSGDSFLLAVPGRHTEEEWPDRGESGFCMWQSIRNSQEYGYWCMVIDWKSGIITEIS